MLASLLLMGGLACFFVPGAAHATTATKGAKVYELSENRTYSSYDITGDGRPDAICIVSEKADPWEAAYEERLAVFVNGKKAFTRKASCFSGIERAQILTLKNGQSFLYLCAQFDYDYTLCRVLKYSSGTLKTVVDCNRFFGSRFASHVGEKGGGEIKKVSGNSITIEFNAMSYMVGDVRARFSYKCKSGTLKRVGNAGVVNVGARKTNTYKAAKTIKAYKATSCKTQKFTIKKGQNVKFLKAYVKGKTVRLQVKAGGKTGWIKCATSYQSSLLAKDSFGSRRPPFEGLHWAG